MPPPGGAFQIEMHSVGAFQVEMHSVGAFQVGMHSVGAFYEIVLKYSKLLYTLHNINEVFLINSRLFKCILLLLVIFHVVQTNGSK